METSNFKQSAYEQKLIGIICRLPPERASQIIDFAQFIEFQANQQGVIESEKEIAAEDARWDALFAADESQHLLEKMADEALAEVQAGHARPIVFTENEEMTSG